LFGTLKAPTIMAHQLTRALALIATCTLLGLSACGSEAPESASSSDAPGNTAAPGHLTAPNHSGSRSNTADNQTPEETAGSIELSLKLGAQQLDSMSYAIVGSGFSKSGNLDVSHSSKVSGVVGGIPFGTNYSLTLSGKGAGSVPMDCSGSTSFDLKDAGPLPVNIQITCKEPAVVEPPTPAPVPPFAVFALACLLGACGIAVQRRTAQG